MTEKKLDIPGKIVWVAAKPEPFYPVPMDPGAKKGGWAVDVEYIDGEGHRMPEKMRFPNLTEARNFVAWERSKLFPEGNEAMLQMSKDEFQAAVGWNVNRVWAYEVRHFLEDKKFPNLRELCAEFLRLYDGAHPEAQSLLKIGLHWSIERLPQYKFSGPDTPLKMIFNDATSYFNLLRPMIERAAILPPVRHELDGTTDRPLAIDTDEQLQALGHAEITAVGEENVYAVVDGMTYYAKLGATERFEVGPHDFSRETFDEPIGNVGAKQKPKMGM